MCTSAKIIKKEDESKEIRSLTIKVEEPPKENHQLLNAVPAAGRSKRQRKRIKKLIIFLIYKLKFLSL